MLNHLLYYGVILPISVLPMWILYRVSDVLYLVVYHIVAYRTKVVRQNLAQSFPEYSLTEIKKIERTFYRHLCDLIVESLKTFTISESLATRKMQHKNTAIFKQLHNKGKAVALVGGHYNNWELFAATISQQIPHAAIALYTPLKNRFFDEKMKATRSKFGLQLLSIHEVKKALAHHQSELQTVIFGADQSPRKSQRAYWMTFLNQETGVQFGTEKLARANNLAVVYGRIHKIKRGKYEVDYELICEHAAEQEEGYITQKHTKLLEKDIRNAPAYWLWTHKRWKHKRPVDSPLNKPLC